MKTNFWSFMIFFVSVLIYLGLIVGAVYLIQFYGWSKWTLLVAMLLMPGFKTIRIGDEKK